MKIDLAKAMAVDNYDWQTTISFDMDQIKLIQGTFPVLEKSPVALFVHHVNDGKMQIRLTVDISTEIPCDRCLEPVSHQFAVEADREIHPGVGEEPSYMKGTVLDADELIFQEILLHWPARILCQEDCKGICPVCGADLNQGECGCDRQVPDPRMAAIQDIFNSFRSEQ